MNEQLESLDDKNTEQLPVDIVNWYEVPEVNASVLLYRPRFYFDDIMRRLEQASPEEQEQFEFPEWDAKRLVGFTLEAMDLHPGSPRDVALGLEVDHKAQLLARIRVPRAIFKSFVDDIIESYENLFDEPIPAASDKAE